jgi:hypothetical protein
LRIDDIPNFVITRGIAARTNRTNGMLPFLNVLKQGIIFVDIGQVKMPFSIDYPVQMVVIQSLTS